MKCSSCGIEFNVEDGLFINEDYLGSIVCPICHGIQDIESELYDDYISEQMKIENRIENKRYCNRNGLFYLI